MKPRERMLQCFRRFGGQVTGISKPTGQAMRFKPGINKSGDLYVIVFIGRSNTRHHALPLDDWAEWAGEYCAFPSLEQESDAERARR